MCTTIGDRQHMGNTTFVILSLDQIDQVVSLTQQLPEFTRPYPKEVYEKRLISVPHLLLGVVHEGQLIGCKLGYDRDQDGSFYSWIGGVHPEHRRKGLAKKLADQMEAWAREQGYRSIRFKTRNRLKAMLQFAIGNGFSIIKVDPESTLGEYRIWLEKPL
ncbi:MAG: GNAT family N-acetyltransferase [Bacteroidota bacterium]